MLFADFESWKFVSSIQIIGTSLAYSGQVVDQLDHLISGLRILIHFSGDGVILLTESKERGRERERERVKNLNSFVP